MVLGFTPRDVRLGWNLFRMSLGDRYLGSTLGGFWAIANPLFMLALYTVVFGFILKVRLPGAETSFGYAIWLISGYAPWLATVEALSGAVVSVTGAAGIVKNLAIKTELLPIAASLLGLVSLVVSLGFLMLLLAIDRRLPGWSLAWLPLVIALQVGLVAGLALWLSAVNVFVRDLALVLPNLLTIVMFSTPIFYSIESMPTVVQQLSYLNPFFQISSAYRAVLLQQMAPTAVGLAYLGTLVAVVGLSGLAVFRRAKGQFGGML